MSPRKDVFIIHTRSNPLHRELVPSVSSLLETVGLKVWQYSDWKWTTDGGSHEVDRATLQEMLATTPGVIVFDVAEDLLTPGMREEARIIDDDFDRLFPLGRFALVSGTEHGFFAERYPMRLGPSLTLEGGDAARSQVVERICLFVLRIIVRQSMLRQVLFDRQAERSASNLDEWAVLGIKLVKQSVHSWRDESDVEIPRLIEELLLWTNSLSVTMGNERLMSGSPRLCEWIANGFAGWLAHDRLSEQGLNSLVDALETIGKPGVGYLERIRGNPTYWDQTDPDERSFSDQALRRSTQILADHYGCTALDFAIEVPADLDDIEAEIEIIAELAQNDHDQEMARNYLLERFESEGDDAEVAAACISALAEIGDQKTTVLLESLAVNDERVEVQLAAVLSLIEIRGPEAQSVAEEFIRKADSDSRIIVASVAWRMNLDSIYDLLLSLEFDPRMLANIQYSLVTAHNPRAADQVLSNLTSDSTYLQAVSAASVVNLLDDLEVDHPFRSAVIPLLEEALNKGQDGDLHLTAVFALIRASQSRYCDQAARILENSLARGDAALARGLIVNAALGLVDWPDDRALRALLYHSDPRVRGAACHLVGRQRRGSFKNELRILEYDPSRVPPYGDGSVKDVQGTVGEIARTALGRLP